MGEKLGVSLLFKWNYSESGPNSNSFQQDNNVVWSAHQSQDPADRLPAARLLEAIDSVAPAP